MDWTIIVSASYVFALALVLLLIFLRSYRKTKEKYSTLLDEKEQRLSRMQIDVEDTMKALEDYAEDVHKDWEQLKSSGYEDYLDMQEQTVKLGASFVELQSQISALSMRISRMETRLDDAEDYIDDIKSRKTSGRTSEAEKAPAPVDEELEAALKNLAAYNMGQSTAQAPKDEELKRVDELSSRTEEALKMLKAGRNILDTAKDLGFSRGELELLSSRYKIK